MTERKRINLALPVSISEQLDKVADELGMNRTSVITMALNQFFQQRESIPAMSELLKAMQQTGFGNRL